MLLVLKQKSFHLLVTTLFMLKILNMLLCFVLESKDTYPRSEINKLRSNCWSWNSMIFFCLNHSLSSRSNSGSLASNLFDHQFNISLCLCSPFEFASRNIYSSQKFLVRNVMMTSHKGGAFLSVESCLSNIQ